jgi:hypothetical protein
MPLARPVWLSFSIRRRMRTRGTDKKSACVKHLTLGLRTICQGNRHLIRRRGHEMRKLIGLAAIAAIAGAVALWSIATFVKSKATAHVQASEASAPVAPHEIMVQQGKSIPVEYFAHPF